LTVYTILSRQGACQEEINGKNKFFYYDDDKNQKSALFYYSSLFYQRISFPRSGRKPRDLRTGPYASEAAGIPLMVSMVIFPSGQTVLVRGKVRKVKASPRTGASGGINTVISAPPRLEIPSSSEP
jgi:hypothetical protein